MADLPRTEDWHIPGSDDQPIYGTTHLPADTVEPRGVALLCHGFKGYKDYGFFPALADRLAGEAVIAHRFNFSHSGMTPRTQTFERPDLFEKDTWSKQREDVLTVSRTVASGALVGAGLNQLWFGHSRGGVSVLLACDRAEDQPAALITAAAPDAAVRFTDEQRRTLREQGRLPTPSNRTGQTLHIGLGWLEEVEADPDAFDPLKAAARVDLPWLILHGDADATVPPEAAKHLADAAGGRAALSLLPGANHVFGGRNPMPRDASPAPTTEAFFDAVVRFARETW